MFLIVVLCLSYVFTICSYIVLFLFIYVHMFVSVLLLFIVFIICSYFVL